jgi:Protein of unknown function (DUF3489)
MSIIKLTDTQLIVLSAAAQREDRCLVAPPKLKGGSAQKFAARLLAAGLVKEIRTKPGMPAWRRDEDAGQSYALKLTAAGMKASAAPTSAMKPSLATSSSTPSAGNPATPGPATLSPRDGSKLALVIGLLSRENGATLTELAAATGWLPHTTRAALTGLRKRGYEVTLDRTDKERGSTYRTGAAENVWEDNQTLSGNEPSSQANGSFSLEAPATSEARLEMTVRSPKRERAVRSPKRKAA